jgi:hypothetical protein
VIFDDGVTTIDFDPVGCTIQLVDRTVTHVSSSGDVIATMNENGLSVRRLRVVTLDRTTSELSTLSAFLLTNIGSQFQYTDDVGRVWDVRWVGQGHTAEEKLYTSSGLHRVSLTLLLEAVNSDAGRTAYVNSDVSQMSIQKSGDTELFFPSAYQHPFNVTIVGTARRDLVDGFQTVDLSRYTARSDKVLNFTSFSPAFMSELDDYIVDSLEGAIHPFTLDHFRDGTSTVRLVGGSQFELGPNFLWSGSFKVREIP